jgi:tripartite-type tricarboxylate transporter receptor subunit TctC
MAPERVAFLEQVFRRAAQSDEYRTAMEARGEVAVGSSAEELRARVAVEDTQIAAIVKSLGIDK